MDPRSTPLISRHSSWLQLQQILSGNPGVCLASGPIRDRRRSDGRFCTMASTCAVLTLSLSPGARLVRWVIRPSRTSSLDPAGLWEGALWAQVHQALQLGSEAASSLMSSGAQLCLTHAVLVTLARYKYVCLSRGTCAYSHELGLYSAHVVDL